MSGNIEKRPTIPGSSRDSGFNEQQPRETQRSMAHQNAERSGTGLTLQYIRT